MHNQSVVATKPSRCKNGGYIGTDTLPNGSTPPALARANQARHRIISAVRRLVFSPSWYSNLVISCVNGIPILFSRVACTDHTIVELPGDAPAALSRRHKFEVHNGRFCVRRPGPLIHSRSSSACRVRRNQLWIRDPTRTGAELEKWERLGYLDSVDEKCITRHSVYFPSTGRIARAYMGLGTDHHRDCSHNGCPQPNPSPPRKRRARKSSCGIVERANYNRQHRTPCGQVRLGYPGSG